MNASPKINVIPNIIQGERVTPDVSHFGDVHNPATGEIIGRTPFSDGRHLDQAVQSAENAFLSWSETPSPQRAKILFRYRELVAEHLDELAQLICLENGKTYEEAKGDVTRGLEVTSSPATSPISSRANICPSWLSISTA